MMGDRLWQRCVLTLALVVGVCWGHGRLVDPPSRASAWRFGWGTPIDYNDNEGFCGGFQHQYQSQGGRCGICGDAWDEDPRPHEAGGKYATGTIVRTYTEGQTIAVRVDITSNHRGHFEFRICPNDNPSVEASQTCLNQHPLFLADGSGFEHKIGTHNGEHLVRVKLPRGLTCTQCVMQWRYVAGNNWGDCEDGSGAVGCGPQEEFRACADVAVVAQPTWTSVGFTDGANDTSQSSESVTSSYSWYSTPDPITPPTLSPTEKPPPPPTTPSRASTRPTRRPTTTRTRPFTRTPRPTRPPTRRTTRPSTRRTTSPRPTTTPAQLKSTAAPSACRAVGVWQNVPGMNEWCLRNCLHTPPFCPASHCSCD
ncbi:uncharacterized protein LOC122250106 isoform X2 [Penaeus japonicus]|nr:uncharacterized protein LOC122250106 isoform X2 [Penaeus japonicus]XP_042867364.1 uncharacterized protein LOC122250106 isoform X2 [Penaeus japonicus]